MKNWLMLVIVMFISFTCSNPNIVNNSENKETEGKISYFDDLSDKQEKENLLSKKDAMIKGFTDAQNSGVLDFYSNEIGINKENSRGLSVGDISLGDVFLVEDNTISIIGDKNPDYYYLNVKMKDSSLLGIGIVSAVDGTLLAASSINPETKIIIGSSEDAKTTVEISLNRSISDDISQIKAEYVQVENNYDRLIQWSWVVILKEKVETRSGNRSVFLVSPFIQVENISQSRNIIMTRNNLPQGYNCRLSIFQTVNEEDNYLNKNDNKYRSNNSENKFFDTVSLDE